MSDLVGSNSLLLTLRCVYGNSSVYFMMVHFWGNCVAIITVVFYCKIIGEILKPTQYLAKKIFFHYISERLVSKI